MASYLDTCKTYPHLAEFVKNAEAVRDEFDNLGGDVTCEFSTSGDDLAAKMEILAKMPVECGRWVVGWCLTCFDQHDGTADFHCELVKHSDNI